MNENEKVQSSVFSNTKRISLDDLGRSTVVYDLFAFKLINPITWRVHRGREIMEFIFEKIKPGRMNILNHRQLELLYDL